MTVDGDTHPIPAATGSLRRVPPAAATLRLAGYLAAGSPAVGYRLGTASCGRPDGPGPAGATGPVHPSATDLEPAPSRAGAETGSGESPLVESTRWQRHPPAVAGVRVLSAAGDQISR